MIASAILWFAAHPTLALLWAGAVLVSQTIDVIAWRPFRQPGRVTPPTQFEWIRLCLSSVQASIVYSAFPVALWFMWGAAGKIFAIVWLCGALLHVTMHMHHEKRTFFSALIPHLIYMFGLPAYVLVNGGEPGRWGAAALILAVILYVMHLVVAFREYRRTSEVMRLGREDAVERQNVAEEANRSKSIFLANMSHEIRTPMNGIIGMAALLETDDLTEGQLEKIKVIRESGDLLLTVLNDLLDFSKIEANRVVFENAPFKPRNLVRRIEVLHKLKAQEKGLSFNVFYEGDPEARFLGDAHRIAQVLHNLIGNAIKFTHQGSISLSIKTPAANETRPIEIEVKDSGIGLSKEQVEHVFEAFAQADATTTRKYGGTGLGLSIVKGLIDSMGGTISVTSAPNEGTSFLVSLPLERAREEESPQRTVRQEQASASDRPLRILIAEDNEVNRLVVESFLSAKGHDMRFAKNGVEAVEMATAERFDIILMDISMPEMDGITAMRKIRKAEVDSDAALQVPIIAVSAHAMSDQVREYNACGFDGYITKPIDAKKLDAEIARAVSSPKDVRSSPAAVA